MISVVNEWIGNPKDFGKSPDAMRLKFIWAGLIKEFIPDVSYTRLAEEAGSPSHASPHDWVRGWYNLPWITRHAWLEFFMTSDNKKMLMKHLAKDPAFQILELSKG